MLQLFYGYSDVVTMRRSCSKDGSCETVSHHGQHTLGGWLFAAEAGQTPDWPTELAENA